MKKKNPKLIQNCKISDPYNKYHVFWEVGHPWFQWFRVSFWVPFGVTFSDCLQKMWFEASKNTHLKNTSKFNGKRSCDKIEPWGVNPLKRRNWEERSSRKVWGYGWQGSVTPKCLKARWRIYIYIYIHMYVYIRIQFAARWAATVPAIYCYEAARFGFVWRGCVCKASIFRGPGGIILGPLGSILASFGRPWALLGVSWELFGDGAEFDTFPAQKWRPFWGLFWHLIAQKSRKCWKNSVWKTVWKKNYPKAHHKLQNVWSVL